MKTTCSFCKTEYSLDVHPASPVQCALCGNTWVVPAPHRKNSFLVFIAATCALLAAGIFSFVLITTHQAKSSVEQNPLVANISGIRTVVDAFGTPHFVVTGRVTNQSGEIYGVPDLLVTSRDENGKIIAQQKFMPSATLLDAGDWVEFTHTLAASTAGVRKVTVELREEQKD